MSSGVRLHKIFGVRGGDWGVVGALFPFLSPFQFQRPARSAISTCTFSGSSSNFRVLTGERYKQKLFDLHLIGLN